MTKKQGVCISFFTAAVIIGVSQANQQTKTYPDQPEIIVSQGLGYGLDKETGSYDPIDRFVAERPMGLYLKAAPEFFDGTVDETEYVTITGEKEMTLYAKDYDAENGVFDFTDSSLLLQAGEWHISVHINDVVVEEDVSFRNMKDISVLVVPVTAMYNGESVENGQVDETLDDFTRKVYPLGMNDLEWDIYEEDSQSVNLEYELNSSTGRYYVWRWLKALDEEGEYDLIVGIVPRNMYSKQDMEKADITGFTFGGNISVISMEDPAPPVTVAHEIGHCYLLGDEYENGTFSLEKNMVPFGMRGKDINDLEQMAEGDCEWIRGGAGDQEQSTGTLVTSEQYLFDIETGGLLTGDRTSFMGLSGYDENEYWTTTDIWTYMYHTLAE